MPNLVVALWSEAKPLVEHFGLATASTNGPFRLFRTDDLALIVSKIGKVSAAAATAFLFAESGKRRDRPWLNVGIAGHRDLPAGEGLLAHKIVDDATGETWYPAPTFDLAGDTATVRTVDRPEDEYASGDLYDMEAAGFYPTALGFSTAELVHTYKIVSDGPATDKASLTAGKVSALVGEHLESLGRIVADLRTAADELEAARPKVDPEPWHGRWRFSVTQGRRLERLLTRLAVVAPEKTEPGAEIESLPDARAVLTALERALSESGGVGDVGGVGGVGGVGDIGDHSAGPAGS